MKIRKPVKPTREIYEAAKKKWESVKPSYEPDDLENCRCYAVTILAYTGNAKLSKYEQENNLRIDFTKGGRVTIRSNFPKASRMKNFTIGDYPLVQLVSSRTKIKEVFDGNSSRGTVSDAIDLYEKDLERKVANNKLSQGSFGTYECRLNKLRPYFNKAPVFADLMAGGIECVLDQIIENESPNYAPELFAELKRVWGFAASKLANGRNIAASIAVDYVSSRVECVSATRLYTDIDSIVELYINIGLAPSTQQKNAMRYMILTGVRPINVCNLRWEWLDDIRCPRKITYPKGTMKDKNRPFELPVTSALRALLKEQRQWQLQAGSCNKEFVFLQPTNPSEAFAVRSLDKLIKDYSPVDCVKGDIENANVKGTNGAFNTMCRKFCKTNIKGLLKQSGRTYSDINFIANLAMHHKTTDEDHRDDMKEPYDFTNELFPHDYQEKFNAFKLHQASILAKAKELVGKKVRKTGREQAIEERAIENQERNKLRAEIKSSIGKKGYSLFIRDPLPNGNTLVKDLILDQEGRQEVREHLSSSMAIAA
ncbi:hypothetical protein RI845_13595 [Thalassotalea nanhaiensis]|uniref:Tyr recombinase domain-containing protein n=1 Tax=Thalassotalea nanhaiensis TaxID=3065648 RepID=A0ABY9TFJ0_9GAMM|nr:hypothetical protein RI845_13595 [Colwelliaceae bacterium SQ345]